MANGRFSLRTLFLPCHHPANGWQCEKPKRPFPLLSPLTGSNCQRLALRETETAVPLPFPFSNCQTPPSQPPASGAATTAVYGRLRPWTYHRPNSDARPPTLFPGCSAPGVSLMHSYAKHPSPLLQLIRVLPDKTAYGCRWVRTGWHWAGPVNPFNKRRPVC